MGVFGDSNMAQMDGNNTAPVFGNQINSTEEKTGSGNNTVVFGANNFKCSKATADNSNNNTTGVFGSNSARFGNSNGFGNTTGQGNTGVFGSNSTNFGGSSTNFGFGFPNNRPASIFGPNAGHFGVQNNRTFYTVMIRIEGEVTGSKAGSHDFQMHTTTYQGIGQVSTKTTLSFTPESVFFNSQSTKGNICILFCITFAPKYNNQMIEREWGAAYKCTVPGIGTFHANTQVDFTSAINQTWNTLDQNCYIPGVGEFKMDVNMNLGIGAQFDRYQNQEITSKTTTTFTPVLYNGIPLMPRGKFATYTQFTIKGKNSEDFCANIHMAYTPKLHCNCDTRDKYLVYGMSSDIQPDQFGATNTMTLQPISDVTWNGRIRSTRLEAPQSLNIPGLGKLSSQSELMYSTTRVVGFQNLPQPGFRFGVIDNSNHILFSNPSSTNSGSAFNIGFGCQTSGTSVKFVPKTGRDINVPGTAEVDVKYNNIACMEEYANKSPEELRFEDYAAGRKGAFGHPGVTGFQQGRLFGTPSNSGTTFGNSTQSFGTTPAGGVILGGNSQTFGTASVGTTFGSNAQTFGTTAAGGITFGCNSQNTGTTSGGTTFGNTQSAGTPSGGTFGSTQNANTPNSIGYKPAFGAKSGTLSFPSVFGKPQNTTNSSDGKKTIFGLTSVSVPAAGGKTQTESNPGTPAAEQVAAKISQINITSDSGNSSSDKNEKSTEHPNEKLKDTAMAVDLPTSDREIKKETTEKSDKNQQANSNKITDPPSSEGKESNSKSTEKSDKNTTDEKEADSSEADPIKSKSAI